MAKDNEKNAANVNKIIRRAIEAPYNKMMKINFIEAEEGSVVLELELKKEYANGIGITHGGVAASLCDAVMGFSAMTLEIIPVTVEMKINYFLPVKTEGVLVAKGKVIKRGNRLIVAEGEIYHSSKLVAKGIGTYIVTNPRD
ncbi:MAG: PaaI family thioesterase [Tepidanaerobacteraceae bacterium]